MSNHHRIHYAEFMARDLAATEAFFSNVFGWGFQYWGDDYMSFSDAGLEGGFFKGDHCADAEAGSALIILYSETLEETRAAVLSAGGEIKKDIFSFPGGRRFHFIEPSGNELAVWSDK